MQKVEGKVEIVIPEMANLDLKCTKAAAFFVRLDMQKAEDRGVAFSI